MTNELRTLLEEAEFSRSHFPSMGEVVLPIGSGICGAAFDGWGLMHRGFRGAEDSSRRRQWAWEKTDRLGGPLDTACSGFTVMSHPAVFRQCAFGKDEQVPLGRIAFSSHPGAVSEYSQKLDLASGTLTTEVKAKAWSYKLSTWFRPDLPEVLAIDLHITGTIPKIILAPVVQDREVSGSFSAKIDGGVCTIETKIAEAQGRIIFRRVEGSAVLNMNDEGLLLETSAGHHFWLVAFGSPLVYDQEIPSLEQQILREGTLAQWKAESVDAWDRLWGDSYVIHTDARARRWWARSAYLLLISGRSGKVINPPPLGRTGAAWPFNFPQDNAMMHSALIRLNHHDWARSWVDFYAARLGAMEAYTQRSYRASLDNSAARGALWAWEFPLGDGLNYLKDGAPEPCIHQLHNAAYPARMAWEAWQANAPESWARESAWPVIQASAMFYSSILRKGHDGLWGIEVLPSMGQDELGGDNAPDYLCALYAADYTLKIALSACAIIKKDDELSRTWRTILSDGLAFKRLEIPGRGFYATNRNTVDGSALGLQKHPVQMIPVYLLPSEHIKTSAVQKAFDYRFGLTQWSAQKPMHSPGWTLPAWILSAVKLGNSDAFLQLFDREMAGAWIDDEDFTCRESTGNIDMPWFLTGHGLILQALTDMVVDTDWAGKVRHSHGLPKEWAGTRGNRLFVAGSCIT